MIKMFETDMGEGYANQDVTADDIEDTGQRRRLTDRVSLNAALELVCTLAFEKALAGKDPAVIASVEQAVLVLREQATGVSPDLKLHDPFHDPEQYCRCGHMYHRHFDSYEHWAPVGCKYCDCMTFRGIT